MFHQSAQLVDPKFFCWSFYTINFLSSSSRIPYMCRVYWFVTKLFDVDILDVHRSNIQPPLNNWKNNIVIGIHNSSILRRLCFFWYLHMPAVSRWTSRNDAGFSLSKIFFKSVKTWLLWKEQVIWSLCLKQLEKTWLFILSLAYKLFYKKNIRSVCFS